MNDILDKLRDDTLSEIFAVEVAGWELVADFENRKMWKTPQGLIWGGATSFATSADAVLPWLEKHGYAKAQLVSGSDQPMLWYISYPVKSGWDEVHGKAPTFARAACIALIRAKRAAK